MKNGNLEEEQLLKIVSDPIKIADAFYVVYTEAKEEIRCNITDITSNSTDYIYGWSLGKISQNIRDQLLLLARETDFLFQKKFWFDICTIDPSSEKISVWEAIQILRKFLSI